MKALVVLSGGQDSTTCLYAARMQNYEQIHAITFDYDQRHRRELESADIIARMAQVDSHEIIRIERLMKSASPLVDKDAPLEQYHSHGEMERIIGNRVELTFVPMRNALFLTIAANRAWALGCEDVYTGVCQADNANYPDCREAFIRVQEATIREALAWPNFAIIAPLLHIPKHDSITMAFKLGGCFQALAWSHTAYDGSYPPSGKDHATVLRAHAFEVAQLPDPLILRAWLTGALPMLPDTTNYAQHHVSLLGAKRIYDTAGLEHVLKLLEHHFTGVVTLSERGLP